MLLVSGGLLVILALSQVEAAGRRACYPYPYHKKSTRSERNKPVKFDTASCEPIHSRINCNSNKYFDHEVCRARRRMRFESQPRVNYYPKIVDVPMEVVDPIPENGMEPVDIGLEQLQQAQSINLASSLVDIPLEAVGKPKLAPVEVFQEIIQKPEYLEEPYMLPEVPDASQSVVELNAPILSSTSVAADEASISFDAPKFVYATSGKESTVTEGVGTSTSEKSSMQSFNDAESPQKTSSEALTTAAATSTVKSKEEKVTTESITTESSTQEENKPTTSETTSAEGGQSSSTLKSTEKEQVTKPTTAETSTTQGELSSSTLKGREKEEVTTKAVTPDNATQREEKELTSATATTREESSSTINNRDDVATELGSTQTTKKARQKAKKKPTGTTVKASEKLTSAATKTIPKDSVKTVKELTTQSSTEDMTALPTTRKPAKKSKNKKPAATTQNDTNQEPTTVLNFSSTTRKSDRKPTQKKSSTTTIKNLSSEAETAEVPTTVNQSTTTRKSPRKPAQKKSPTTTIKATTKDLSVTTETDAAQVSTTVNQSTSTRKSPRKPAQKKSPKTTIKAATEGLSVTTEAETAQVPTTPIPGEGIKVSKNGSEIKFVVTVGSKKNKSTAVPTRRKITTTRPVPETARKIVVTAKNMPTEDRKTTRKNVRRSTIKPTPITINKQWGIFEFGMAESEK